MKVRKFLEKMVGLCVDDELLSGRLTEHILLTYDKELKNPKSIFSMTEYDKKNPKDRLEFLFLFKHIDKVDTRKAQRCQDLIELIALHSYKNKYEAEDYDVEIRAKTMAIESQPVPEIDSQLPLETITAGVWNG
jgi:hypothetical protein